MVKNKIEIFRKTEKGRQIKSYGTLLMVFGIIYVALAIFDIAFLFATVFSDNMELTGLGVGVIVYYTSLLLFAIYCINRGIKIRNFLLKPSQTLSSSILIIVLILIIYIASNILKNQIVPGEAVGFGIFNLIVLISSIIYCARCHKTYMAAYNGEYIEEEHQESSKKPKKEKAVTESETSKTKDYYDDMI